MPDAEIFQLESKVIPDLTGREAPRETAKLLDVDLSHQADLIPVTVTTQGVRISQPGKSGVRDQEVHIGEDAIMMPLGLRMTGALAPQTRIRPDQEVSVLTVNG